MLDEARREGLNQVELTADFDNEPSHKVILANGGEFVGRFRPKRYPDKEHFRYRIRL